MQIPASFSEVEVGMVVEKDGEEWQVIRLVDQTTFKGGVVVQEKYIQLLSRASDVSFHHFSVEVKK